MAVEHRVVVTRSGEVVLERVLAPGVTTLGRSRHADVSLDGAKDSRHHAILFVSAEGDCHLQDTGSKNGTFLGRRRVGRVRLEAGDVFHLGPYACELRVEESGAPARTGDPSTMPAAGSETAGEWAAAPAGSGIAGGVRPFLGASPATARLLVQARRAADTDLAVLICGESGSGKGVVASLIHGSSARSMGPFIVVNCAAIPGELVESELFGHRRGAFTGAVSDRLGKFRAADRGTLFLDEIGDLSLPAQAKILRAIEDQEIEPLGEPSPVRVDVRVLAATHQDLAKAVAAGSFRGDLFHRIATLTLDVPPLRERKEDVVLLANWFLAQLIDEIPWAQGAAFASDAIDALVAHDWPGNVRELRNTVAQALVARDGELIRREHVRFARSPDRGSSAPDPSGARPPIDARGETLEDVEARHVARALDRHAWNLSRAAKTLGIARSTLRERIARLGLRRGSPG
jgi:DNA-binding NtrC family response regulator